MSHREHEARPTVTVNLIPIILILLASPVIILIIKALGSDWMHSRITAYPALCNETVYLNQCASPNHALAKIIYKIYPRTKTVYWWVEGGDAKKVTDCQITNRTNWACPGEAGETFGFENGQYWKKSQHQDDTTSTKIYYTTKGEWLRLQCSNSNPLCAALARIFN